VHLQVWAPRALVGVDVVAAGPTDSGRPLRTALPADPVRPGWYAGEVGWLRHDVRYRLSLDGADPVPDPLARRLPDGVHGPAQAWDPSTHVWQDDGWAGRALRDAGVVYELHVGTFTRAGTLDAAAEHLGHLRDLGTSHVELMPLSAFDGPHGWGYDGVALDAVHEPYGGPDALCRFVDAAHVAGLAVLLDLVHNHLGPSGDYWDRFGPLRTGAHRTPWGAAINLDQPGSDDVRAILLGSARRWLADFHLDGLRLDAVHALHDQRALTYLEELAARIDDLAVELGRPLALVAESDRNDPGTVLPRAAGGAGGPGLTAPGSGLGLTAQWDDDVHHALHWLTTGETQGYYADFGSGPALAHTLQRAFWHDGRWSSFRGRTHGRPVDWARTDPWRFVVSVQTHDQVGNRAAGDRIAALVGPDRAAAAAAILLTLPYTPMLFMGEEWGETTPWPYFSSFPDAVLGTAVSEGRRAEFERHGWGAPDVPDPQDPATYEAARLDPVAGVAGHPEMVAWYRELLALRRREPGLLPASAGPGPTAGALHCRFGAEPVAADDPRPSWVVIGRPGWRTVVNLRDDEQDVPLDVAGLAAVGGATVELAWLPCTLADADDRPGGTVRLPGHGSAVVRVTEVDVTEVDVTEVDVTEVDVTEVDVAEVDVAGAGAD
jgi:maltooligosyltrehalose trehalohydrolase